MKKAASTSYYIQRGGTEEGPLSPAQINRMKQRGLITADTPCRAESDSAFRRLDEVFPHLKDYKGPDPEKMAKLKHDITAYEIKSLIATAFGAGAFFWIPRGGGVGALTAIACGLALVFRHRQPIGFAAILVGVVGLYLRL